MASFYHNDSKCCIEREQNPVFQALLIDVVESCSRDGREPPDEEIDTSQQSFHALRRLGIYELKGYNRLLHKQTGMQKIDFFLLETAVRTSAAAMIMAGMMRQQS